MTVAPVIGEHDHQHPDINCIICSENITFSDVTAGSLYADGNQAFACRIHFEDRTQWITSWALFETEQSIQASAWEATS
jgi:hypothetical protein